jgi:Protein of unknown function (DUF4242)
MRTMMLVEYAFDPPATDKDFSASETRLKPCLEARGITWQRSYISKDRRRRICVFEAVDAEAVRTAYHSAGVKFERVWSADLEE